MTPPPATLRIANCSGFYGDRLAAAREMVDGGPIDVLTGDWLAELTMFVLARGTTGYARTFVTQMADVLGDCSAKDIKVVSNAGGLDPAGCAAAVRKLATDAGLDLTVAHIEGDDLSARYPGAVTANAYLGAWGIVEALRAGADVVITGRVTDASVVVGPAAWHFGWSREDWDELAAAVVAGHLLEGGAQVTGGNYAYFTEVPGLERPGFPLVEMEADSSFVVTKHPGTGGVVSVGTVTAQLLTGMRGPDHVNPDAVVRLNSIRLDEDGPDRVRVHEVRGMPGPATAKVALNHLGGYRNSMTFGITGLLIEDKAALVERTLFPDGRGAYDDVDVQLRRYDDGADLRVTVVDADRTKVGRAFTAAVVELTLASYPGLYLTDPPKPATEFGLYSWDLVPADAPEHVAVVGDRRIPVPAAPTAPPPLVRRVPTRVPPTNPARAHVVPTAAADSTTMTVMLQDLRSRRLAVEAGSGDAVHWSSYPTWKRPLGDVAGARSIAKGGDVNIGVWVPSADAYDWLQWYLDTDRFRTLLDLDPAVAVQRHELANLNAINFVIEGFVGRRATSSTGADVECRSLGERLRSCEVEPPMHLCP